MALAGSWCAIDSAVGIMANTDFDGPIAASETEFVGRPDPEGLLQPISLATFHRLAAMLNTPADDQLWVVLQLISRAYVIRTTRPSDRGTPYDQRAVRAPATRRRLRRAARDAIRLASLLIAVAEEDPTLEWSTEPPAWKALRGDAQRMRDANAAALLRQGLLPPSNPTTGLPLSGEPKPYPFHPGLAASLLRGFAAAAEHASDGNPKSWGTLHNERTANRPLQWLVGRLGYHIFEPRTGRPPTVSTDCETGAVRGPFLEFAIVVVDACTQYDRRCHHSRGAIAQAIKRELREERGRMLASSR
jgi:hypothetical protein